MSLNNFSALLAHSTSPQPHWIANLLNGAVTLRLELLDYKTPATPITPSYYMTLMVQFSSRKSPWGHTTELRQKINDGTVPGEVEQHESVLYVVDHGKKCVQVQTSHMMVCGVLDL